MGLVTYDYPATRAATYDQWDLDAMRAALSLGMPLFLIRDTNAKADLVRGKGPRRRVDRVEIDELEGRITTMLVTPYPPGIPLLIPGERFNRTIVEYLKFVRSFHPVPYKHLTVPTTVRLYFSVGSSLS